MNKITGIILKKILIGTALVSGLMGCSNNAPPSSTSEETVYIPEYTDYVSVQECGGYPKYEILKKVESYYFDDSGYLVRYIVSDWYDFGYSAATPKNESDLLDLASGMQDSGYRRVYAVGNILVREYSDEQLDDTYINRHEPKEDIIADANALCLTENGCLIEENEGVCTAQVDYNPDDLLEPEGE